MRKLIAMVLSIALYGPSFAITEKVVESEIDQVTVFLQGAQIHRKSKVYVSKGTTTVIFEGMSRNFNKNSIQVKGKGDFIIMDVSSKIHYPEPVKVETNSTETPVKILKEIAQIQDSLVDIEWDLTELNNKVTVYNSEKNILLNSGVVKGQGQNDSILALKDAMEYLRVKLLEINALTLNAQIKVAELNKLKSRMNVRLSELQNYQYNQNQQNQYKAQPLEPMQQIIVTVSSDYATSGYIEVNYMVPSAGWSPAYDLRADDISSPVKLTYKANVYQNTGVDWDGVDVTLSTINPNRSNNKPSLAPWYIDFYRPIQRVQTYNNNATASTSALKDDYQLDMAENEESLSYEIETDAKKLYSMMPAAKQISNYTQMSENMAMVQFDLKLKQSIPSDGQNHMMAVKSEKIDSDFEHFIVPKMDNDAFLVAHLTNWEELNLLPAVANIYYDGTYVGQTRINPTVMADTLDLALGRDRGIYVTRKKKSDEEKVKPLSSEKSKTVTYEIAIKNYKSSTVNLTIEDQLPITNNEDIEIEVGDVDKAERNKKNGTLTWKRKISPKETERLRFTYTIKYDKDKQLAANYY